MGRGKSRRGTQGDLGGATALPVATFTSVCGRRRPTTPPSRRAAMSPRSFAEGRSCWRASAYRCPLEGHAPFAPNCAVADVKPDSAHG